LTELRKPIRFIFVRIEGLSQPSRQIFRAVQGMIATRKEWDIERKMSFVYHRAFCTAFGADDRPGLLATVIRAIPSIHVALNSTCRTGFSDRIIPIM
jgi:hypothetical protein